MLIYKSNNFKHKTLAIYKILNNITAELASYSIV